jgi:Fic family protein
VRSTYDERNFVRAYEYCSDLDGDPLDHLVDIHSVLVKDTLDQHLYGFRDTPVQLVEVTGKKVLKVIPVMNFLVEIKRLSQEKRKFNGLDQIAFEHIELLKIHPFHDGNGRLARFITCKRLADMEAKYFYKYLEKKSDEHIEAITQVFYKDKGFKAFADFLRRITVF